MDILSHTFSGMAIGTVAMQFCKGGFKEKSKVLLFSTLGGFIPDLDALSYWSGFDATIGNFFNLDKSGTEIYHSKVWYAHHAFNHSLLAAVLYSFIIYLVFIFFNRDKKSMLLLNLKAPVLLGFFCGFMIHIFEDMPTPEFAWGGVALLFPSTNYTGGFGNIWWWNNYDLFLIIISVVFLNIIISVIGKSMKKNVKKVCLLIFILGTLTYFFQMNTRRFDFKYIGFTEHINVRSTYEKESKLIQKEILGDYLFKIMTDFDNYLPFYF
jgi:inner membrane protein